uniref:Copper-containing nitrite reductase n=1 Tax=Ditylenchus dipsaci TaxID=166011 RepID=A0A915D5E1_9BILA
MRRKLNLTNVLTTRQFGALRTAITGKNMALTGGIVLAGGLSAAIIHLLKPKMETKETLHEFLIPVNDLRIERSLIVSAPHVPPPIQRDYPVRLHVKMNTTAALLPLTRQYKYQMWTFNDCVPGPFIRARVGDVLEIEFTNKDEQGIAHNIDFHAATGPGGGSPLLNTEKDETATGRFRLLYPGLYIYHCAAAPIPMHIANGMYGLVLVEPKGGLPPVDKEFYVMQSEFYTEPSLEDPKGLLDYSYMDGLNETPQYVLFNGREGALTDSPLQVKAGETVRIYFGNAGPNLSSAFHVIGAIFDKVYRDGGLISPPAEGIQTTLVPPGGSTVVDIKTVVPGTYTLVDHAIHRIDKGAVDT